MSEKEIEMNKKSIPSYDEPESSLTEEDLADEAEISFEEGLDEAAEMDLDTDILPKSTDIILTRREDTRSKLALFFTIATFTVFILTLIIATIDGLARNVSIIDNITSVIPTISGVFLGSLGFVLGYYFRKSEDE